MRAPSCFAVAVRDSKNRIVIRDRPWRSIGEKLRVLRWPFLRGAVVLGESLANGMNALAYSAKIAAEGEESSPRSSVLGSQTGQEPDPTVGAPRRDASSASGPSAPAGALAPRLEGSGRRGSPTEQDMGPGRGRTENREPRTESSAAAGAPSFGWLFIPTLLFALLVFKGVPHPRRWPSTRGSAGTGSPATSSTSSTRGEAAVFVGYLLLISRMKEIQRVFAYHGAEHKAIATHEAREELTVANARAHSRFHPAAAPLSCSSSSSLGVLLYMSVLPLLPPLVHAVAQPGAAHPAQDRPALPHRRPVLRGDPAVREVRQNPVVRLLIGPGLLLQRLVTREPTDEQLEIALASIAVALSEEATAAARARDKATVLPERERAFDSYAAFIEELPGWTSPPRKGPRRPSTRFLDHEPGEVALMEDKVRGRLEGLGDDSSDRVAALRPGRPDGPPPHAGAEQGALSYHRGHRGVPQAAQVEADGEENRALLDDADEMRKMARTRLRARASGGLEGGSRSSSRPATRSTARTSSSRSAPAPGARRRPSSPPSCSGCTCATPSSSDGRSSR